MRADVPCVSEDLLRCDYVVLISPQSTSLFRLHWAIKYLKKQRRPPPCRPGKCLGSVPRQPGPPFKPSKSSIKSSPSGLPGKTLPPLICVSLPAVPAPAPELLAPSRPDVLPHAHLPYFTAVSRTSRSSQRACNTAQALSKDIYPRSLMHSRKHRP